MTTNSPPPRLRTTYLGLRVLAQIFLASAFHGVFDLLDGRLELVIVLETGILEPGLDARNTQKDQQMVRLNRYFELLEHPNEHGSRDKGRLE